MGLNKSHPNGKLLSVKVLFMITTYTIKKVAPARNRIVRLWRKRNFEISLALTAFLMSLGLAMAQSPPNASLSPLAFPDGGKQAAPLSATHSAMPTVPQQLVILATSPQADDVKAYGDMGSLIGGMLSRNLKIELQETTVLSPLEATAQLQRNGRMADRHYFLSKLDVKQGFSNQDATMMIQGLNLGSKPQQFLILRSDIDFTRPYAPPTRWAKFVSWFRDSLNEEAWGYVDVDIVRYDLNPKGNYIPHHQWHDTFRLPTDRITSVSTSVYDDPTANTWGSRLGQQVFDAYWKDHSSDYGVVKNLNPLNQLTLPRKEQLKFDEQKFPQSAKLNQKIETLPLNP
jgi:hypothetical protein